jgi:diketogulonate reductase-like aldo/keto reductase
LAEKYGKKAGQIILNWHLHRGHVIIPKTTKVERLSENFNVYDFTLTDEEYASISALDRNARFFNPKVFKEYGWNYLPYFE